MPRHRLYSFLFVLLGPLMCAGGWGCAAPADRSERPDPSTQAAQSDLIFVYWQRAFAAGDRPGAVGPFLAYVKEEKRRVEDRLFVSYLVYGKDLTTILGFYTPEGETYRAPRPHEETPVYLGNYEPGGSVGALTDHDGGVLFGPMDWEQG